METALIVLAVTALGLAIVVAVLAFKLVAVVQEPAKLAASIEKIKFQTGKLKDSVEKNTPK